MASRKPPRPSRATTSSDTPLSSGTFAVSRTRAGRVSVSASPKRPATACAKPLAPTIGSDTRPAARDQDLLADRIGMLRQQDAAAALAGTHRAHQARGAGARDDDVEVAPVHASAILTTRNGIIS